MVGNPRAVKLLDRALQQWSIRKAATYLKTGDPVLDVGCADGTCFAKSMGLANRSVWTGTSNSIIHQRYPSSFYPRAISTSSAR